MTSFSAQAQAVLSTIKQRRTVDLPNLAPTEIDLQIIEAILEAGIWAPTHGRTQPWRFTVFTGAGRARLGNIFADAYRVSSAPDRESETTLAAQRERTQKAPVWISLELHIPQPPKMPAWEEEAALACAAQNIMLAASAFGIVSKWVSGPVMVSPVTAAALGAPQLFGFIYLGYQSTPPIAGIRAPLSEKMTWIK